MRCRRAELWPRRLPPCLCAPPASPQRTEATAPYRPLGLGLVSSADPPLDDLTARGSREDREGQEGREMGTLEGDRGRVCASLSANNLGRSPPMRAVLGEPPTDPWGAPQGLRAERTGGISTRSTQRRLGPHLQVPRAASYPHLPRSAVADSEGHRERRGPLSTASSLAGVAQGLS